MRSSGARHIRGCLEGRERDKMDTENKISSIGTMQPLYRIPGEMLRAHVARLSLCPRVKESQANLYSLLFLSGLHVTYHFYKESGIAPLHFLDDGLCETARSCMFFFGETRAVS